MKVLIIYDSFFGNTAKVALSMKKALQAKGEVLAIPVSDFSVQHLQNCSHLFIGSPTRAFQPTPLIKQLISNLSKKDLQEIKVLVFDTRMEIEKIDVKILQIFAGWFGFANDTMQKKLQRKVNHIQIEASGFFVEESEGPLSDGELERAALWAVEQVK